MYSNSYCSYKFAPEQEKIGQSSHKEYSNNILKYLEFTAIINACTKKSLETYCMHLVRNIAVVLLLKSGQCSNYTGQQKKSFFLNENKNTHFWVTSRR